VGDVSFRATSSLLSSSVWFLCCVPGSKDVHPHPVASEFAHHPDLLVLRESVLSALWITLCCTEGVSRLFACDSHSPLLSFIESASRGDVAGVLDISSGGLLSGIGDVIRQPSLDAADVNYLAISCLWQVVFTDPVHSLPQLLQDEVRFRSCIRLRSCLCVTLSLHVSGSLLPVRRMRLALHHAVVLLSVDSPARSRRCCSPTCCLTTRCRLHIGCMRCGACCV
jgi:hypothetical protein